MERTPESLAAAFTRLARDPALRRRLGAEGCRRVSAWTWDANVDQIVALYQDLAQPHRALAEVSHVG